jgi:hypothetical protein
MTTLVLGASGATGRLLVQQLIDKGEDVKVIVRSMDGLPPLFKDHQQITITQASLLDMSEAEIIDQVKGCRAVVSCLGHNLSFKGIFGYPRRLVKDVLKKVCYAIQKTSPERPVKYILMNTTGNQNKQAGEKVSLCQSIVVGLIRFLIPPHADNEEAAKYLQTNFGNNHKVIEWAAVRPDSLTDEEVVSQYSVYTSPIRSAIFVAGKTSRINVAHFMSQLVTCDETWSQWKGHMPVIYNEADIL